ncbi:MAG: SDR family NAD(P)-dependent oxidoreductase [Frankiaceae bacterium]
MRDALGGLQHVLVLGGTSELGMATLRELNLRPGARVVLAGRDPEACLAAAPQLPGVEVVVQPWDARDTGSASALVDAVLAEGRDLDLVLAAAGIVGDQEQAEKDPSVAVEVLQTNLVGVVAVLLPLAAALRGQGHGHLVLFSSVAGLRGRRANYVYGASKAGLDAFAEGLSAALAGSGVAVTVVRPGFVTGRMTRGMPTPPLASTPRAVGTAVAEAIRRRAEVVYVPATLGPVFGALRLLPRRLFRKVPG